MTMSDSGGYVTHCMVREIILIFSTANSYKVTIKQTINVMPSL